MESKEKKFTGTVISNFVVGTKKPKSYSVGDKFETTNEDYFKDLVKNQKIK